MRWLVIVSILSLLTLPARANDTEALGLCDKALTLCEEELKLKNSYIKAQDETITILIKQRNEAYEEAGKNFSAVPWYVWTITGVAAGLVLGHTVVFK